MGQVTLKGPNRLGAAELDEGEMTRAVVAVFAAENGSGGQAAAEAVLPARRELWQLAEVYMPQALARSLRGRLALADQTGRGGVREMRRALADWLDPPPLCAHCGRNIDPQTEGIACTRRPQRTWAGVGRHPAPTTCRPRRGPPALRGGAAMARSVARCGTLALFTPIHLDPACAAAARLLRHGAAAYDLVVDRDARTLLEVTRPPAFSATLGVGGDIFTMQAKANKHDGQHSTPHPLVAAARRRFDRTLERAIRANGPLILKCQLRQYSPNGSTTRADLVQGAAMGCRRALLDYDARVATFSTYAIHWMRQGGGEAFAARDLVNVPDWAVSLRRGVEARDLLPMQLLRLIGAVAETRSRPHAADANKQRNGDKQKRTLDDGEKDLETFGHAVILARQTSAHAEAVAALIDYADLTRAVVLPATKATKGVAAKPAKTLAPALTNEAMVAMLLRAAAKPARSKVDPSDERARERVAAVVAARLGLSNTVKPIAGAAMLAALRYGASVVVGIGTGEHDDGSDSDSQGGHKERLPEHLADDAPDPEEQALEEDQACRELAAMLAALEALRAVDPEAAEAVRRRHGMDSVGEPETFEQIAAAGLRSTGRSRCREGIRQAYERGVDVLRSSAPALLGRLAADVGHEAAAHIVNKGLGLAATTPLEERSPNLRRGNRIAPNEVAFTPRCYEFHAIHVSTLTPEEFGAWAAERDAMAAAF